VGTALRDGQADLGVLICGSGAGVAIAANKIRGVRAALCHDPYTARQAREDDDANVICLGARVVSLEQALELVRVFVAARFSGQERHVRRLAKVLALEAECGGAAAARPWQELPEVVGARERLARLRAGPRIWHRDPTLWSDVPDVCAAIARRLGWLDAPTAMRAQGEALRAFAATVREAGFTEAVVLGMGGSSLAAEVLASVFPPGPGGLALRVLDTTDPDAIRALRRRLPLERTLFVVASKSGTTLEVHALYRYFRAEIEAAGLEPGPRFVALTDAGTPLARLAAEAGFRETILAPPDVGGRFSALTPFGLLPAALLGVDPGDLLDRAATMAAACGPEVPVGSHPALDLAAALGGFALAGRDKVTLLLSDPLRPFGAWLEQLLTESTGKQGRGLVVVTDEPPGAPGVYGSDRLFVALSLGGDPELDVTEAALRAVGQPVVRLELRDRLGLGGEFFRWELATAAVGALLGVNPFDEPNVAQAKAATQSALAAFRERGCLPDWPADGAEEVARTLRQARPGDYVALLAYLPPEPAVRAALERIRRLVRDRTRLATTVGFGPRYLHAAGQLHKGGPPTPILIFLTREITEDLPIPGERWGFGTLLMAQALGDLATLRAAQRRALWVPLRSAAAEELDALAATLDRALS
jgi:glucose-6-phosphate isomerase